jgi:steroid 5-alpha reductase family enzyme
VQLYIETNPLVTAAAVSIFLGAIFWVASEINRNYSQVDRAWSILPALYIGHLSLWARLAGEPHDRIDVVAMFATIWSMRLTYNYWRRGGYSIGSEDYRW